MSYPRGIVRAMPNDRIAPIARRQHGLVTSHQVRGVVSAPQLARLLRDRKLEPVRRGVYRVAGAPHSWRQSLLAACLARPSAYASFRSAAALWDLEGFPRRRRRDHGAGIQPRSARGRHRAREHGLRAPPSRHRGRHSRRLRRPDPVRSHRGRPAMDDRARGGRGLASQDRRRQDPRRGRPRPRGSRATALHRDARDPRAPGSGLPPRRERSREAHRQAARTRRPAGAHVAASSAPGRQDLSHRPLLSGAADRDRVRQLEAPFGPLGLRPRPGPWQRPRSPRVPPSPLHVTIGRSADRRLGGGRARLEHPSVEVRIRQRSDGCS